MPTYEYETLGAKKRNFELRQSMMDAPLTHDPETGEPVRRVISGGYGFMEKGAAKKSAKAAASRGHGHCCGGGGCGCH